MINLVNPWNLLWALPVVGGILALWLLRVRRQPATVSSLFLWRSVLDETSAHVPFQKLRRHLLLFLQLLAAFLLILALARPFVYGRNLPGRAFVLVIDTSASMSATDLRPSRLDAAKSAAEDAIRREMDPSDVAAVITAGPSPQTIVRFTGSHARLTDAIDGIRGTDATADITDALTLAQSLVASRDGAQVRVFTDGVWESADARRAAGLSFGGTGVRQILVGTPDAANVGITAMDGRRDPATGRMQVFVDIRRFGIVTTNSDATISLLQGGHLIDARALSLASGSQSETFDSPLLARGGVITARLDGIQDDLAADNVASLVLSAPQKSKYLLVSNGNLFLERGLNLDPDALVDECAPTQFTTEGHSGAGYSLVVFDGALPAGPLPPGNYLIFNAANSQTPLTPVPGKINKEEPGFVDQDRTDPVMRFVDLTGLRVRRTLPAAVSPWAKTLADGTSGPWIAAGEQNGRRMVSVSFALSDSDWPLRVSFPIFLSNAADWLAAGSRPGSIAEKVAPGTAASVVVPAGLSGVTVTDPDGASRAVAVPTAGGLVTDPDCSQVGVYHVRAGEGIDYPFAVDLLNPAVSDLAPHPHPEIDHAGIITSRSVPLSAHVKQGYWSIVAAVALAALLLEWFVYHRRFV